MSFWCHSWFTCQIILRLNPVSECFISKCENSVCICFVLFWSVSYFHLCFSAGPGPIQSPTVSELHPRTVTVTWIPPSQPNGVITNYTICLRPSTDTTLHPSSALRPSILPPSEGSHLNLGDNLRPPSTRSTLSSRDISTSAFNNGIEDSSNIIQGTRPSLLSKRFSSLRPGVTENKQIESSSVSNTGKGPSSILFHPTEPSTSNPSPRILIDEPDYNRTSSDTEQFIKDPSHSPISSSSSSSSDASDSSSVTLPGNVTSYTFLNLLPYHTYSLQVLSATQKVITFS